VTLLKKSPNDRKSYQLSKLDNGLRVLLIHNDGSNQAAAALAVNVGHFNDPKERQGLAHFLEHMLFLGTEKYPDGSEYQKFISQYGGTNNAWTATEHTCFFFDISAQHFDQALDRFGQFFTAPLLSSEFVDKERQNIDAEYKLKLKDDIRRLYDVHKETVNQQHPFSQFSVGNIETLADRPGQAVRDEVAAFFDEFYRADYMTLVLEGPQCLDQLLTLAKDNFSDIKAAACPLPAISTPLYCKDNQGIMIQVVPIKNDRQLIISFAMPSIDKYYRNKPELVIAYLIGHEGPGSILSLLKHQQWAMGISAGSGINGSNFKDFNISISLTPQGEAHVDEILDIVFGYLTLLKQQPLPLHYFTEKQILAELSFTHHEPSRPLDSVSQLVLNMQHYPPEDYIYGDYVMDKMCHVSINKLLTYLSPDNMRLIHISQSHQPSRTSLWYQTPYHVIALAQEKLLAWRHATVSPQLFLAPVNSYITNNLKVLPHSTTSLAPKLVEQLDGLNVWFKQDTTFKVPQGHIYIAIDSPVVILSDKHIAMTRLFANLYSDSVVEQNYDAELAGIHYHLYSNQGGLTLHLSGISQGQDELLTRLLTSLINNTIPEQRFELFKQQLIQHWLNADKSKSISQLFSTLSSVMQPNNPSNDNLAQLLAEVSYREFTDFSQTLFTDISLEVLIHGNWLEQDSLLIINNIKQVFCGSYSSSNQVNSPLLDINKQGELLIPMLLPEHDHASVIYYPQHDKAISTTAVVMLTSHLLSPLFFEQMRTEKQYGYLVGVGYMPINRYPGLAFYIQSPHTKSQDLIEAMDHFLANCLDYLASLSKHDWHEVKQGLAGQLQEKAPNIHVKSQRFWAAICNKDRTFSHKDQLMQAIKALSQDQVTAFISQQLDNTNQPDRLVLATTQKQGQKIKRSTAHKIVDDKQGLVNNNKRKD
jgi:insulysin